MPTIMPMSVVPVSCMHEDKVVQNHTLHAEPIFWDYNRPVQSYMAEG